MSIYKAIMAQSVVLNKQQEENTALVEGRRRCELAQMVDFISGKGKGNRIRREKINWMTYKDYLEQAYAQEVPYSIMADHITAATGHRFDSVDICKVLSRLCISEGQGPRNGSARAMPEGDGGSV